MHCDADPGAQLNEAVQATLFTHHPYGTPIIGWSHEIEGLGPRGRARLLRALLHAGERDPDRRRRRRGRGGAPSSPSCITARSARAATPPQRSGRTSPRRSRAASSSSTTKRSSSRAGSAAISPPPTAPPRPAKSDALEVLAHLLGGGQTSLLYRKLVLDEKKARRGRRLLHGLGARRDALLPLRDAGPRRLLAGARRGGRPRARAASSPTASTPNALERAKTRLVADAIYAQDSQVDAGALVRRLARHRPDDQRRPGMAGAHRSGRRAEDVLAAARQVARSRAAPSPAICCRSNNRRRPESGADAERSRRRRESRRAPRKRSMNIPVANPAASSAVNVRDLVTPARRRAWLVEDYAVPLVSLEFALPRRRGAGPRRQGRRGDDAGRPARRRRGRSRRPGLPAGARREGDRDSPSTASATTSADGCGRWCAMSTAPANCCGSRSTRRASTRRRSTRVREQIDRPDCATRPTIPARSPAAPGARGSFPAIPMRLPTNGTAGEPRRGRARRPAGAGAAAHHPRGACTIAIVGAIDAERARRS